MSMLRSNGSQLSSWASVQQLVAGQHPVGVAHQHLEQVELHAGQRHLLAVAVEQAARPPGRGCTGRCATRLPSRVGLGLDAACRLAAACRPPQHGADSRQQLAQLERLDHIVVGADLQADDPVDRLAHGRHHDHRHVEMLAHAAQDGDAVLAGHAQVEQHQIDRLAAPGSRAARPVGGLAHHRSPAAADTPPRSCAGPPRRRPPRYGAWVHGLQSSDAPRCHPGSAMYRTDVAA